MIDYSWLERTELLVGEEQLQKLINSNVLVVGLVAGLLFVIGLILVVNLIVAN